MPWVCVIAFAVTFKWSYFSGTKKSIKSIIRTSILPVLDVSLSSLSLIQSGMPQVEKGYDGLALPLTHLSFYALSSTYLTVTGSHRTKEGL